MKATINAENSEGNAVNHSGKKELIKLFRVIAKTPTGWQEPIEARCYMSFNSDGAAPVYAAVWIRGSSVSGRGKASGYGYHKVSAAIAEALGNAGIKLSEDISGRGDSSVCDALTAIAAALGHTDIYIQE